MPRAKKLTVDRLLRLACYHAEISVRDLIECERVAYPDRTAEDEAFVEQLHEYRLKRWGLTPAEIAMRDGDTISVEEVARRHFATKRA